MFRVSLAGATAAIALLATSVIAHPGTGIVRDSRGNIYYTDLARVWKISPSGERTVAVQSVHTHELYLDSLDNLYGEHLWYEGERTDRWRHRVWRLSPDGRLTDIISAREGFRDDHDAFHFDWDRRGRMYWFDRGDRSALRRRDAAGRVATLVDQIPEAGRMAVTAEGVVYFLAGGDLRRVDERGNVSTLARNLRSRRLTEHLMGDSHNIMGLWTDADMNVYLAVLGGRVVKRVDPAGRVNEVIRSESPWGPTGGFIDPSGDLWLLESSDMNTVRVRRIRNGQTVTLYSP
jgi:hypothetical protein